MVTMAVLLIGIVGTVLGGLLRTPPAISYPLDSYFHYAVPGLAFILAVLAIALWLWPSTLARVQLVMIGTLLGHLAINVALVLFTTPTADQTIRELVAFNYWLPASFVLAYALFEPRTALGVAVVFYLATAGIAAAYVVMAPHEAAGGSAEASGFLMTALINQFFVAHGMYIAMLAVFLRLKDVVKRTQRSVVAMRELAHTDVLTGLMNRRALQFALEKAMSADSRIDGGGFSVVLIDLDHFKQVNDRFGHDAGDAVLKHVAKVLQETTRATDATGRWGGEEFMVVLPGCDVAKAAVIAEKLRKAVSMRPLKEVGRVTASFGVVARQPGDSLDTLIIRADGALYAAKDHGRDRVHTAIPTEAVRPSSSARSAAIPVAPSAHEG